jgi:hypothetical protein
MSVEAMKKALAWIKAQTDPCIDDAWDCAIALHTAIERAEKREWTDLTAAELTDLIAEYRRNKDGMMSFVRRVELLVKEKNQ